MDRGRAAFDVYMRQTRAFVGRLPLVLVLVLVLVPIVIGLGCRHRGQGADAASEPASGPAAPASASAEERVAQGPEPASSAPENAEPSPLAGAAERFAAARVDGAFVLRQAGAVDREYGGERLDLRRNPCSTFKIPNALIALETGVVADVDTTLPWDGVERWASTWNRDHDLRSAMEFSVVWYFQALARGITAPLMKAWLSRFAYGDLEIGDTVDTFWLEGPLTISAREQVGFVDRLVHGRLPVSERSAALVRSIVPAEEFDGVTLRAKTGTCVYDDGRPPHAWLVGWVEDGEDGEEVLGSFALLLTEGEDVNALMDVRWQLASALLVDAGLLGADALTSAELPGMQR